MTPGRRMQDYPESSACSGTTRRKHEACTRGQQETAHIAGGDFRRVAAGQVPPEDVEFSRVRNDRRGSPPVRRHLPSELADCSTEIRVSCHGAPPRRITNAEDPHSKTVPFDKRVAREARSWREDRQRTERFRQLSGRAGSALPGIIAGTDTCEAFERGWLQHVEGGFSTRRRHGRKILWDRYLRRLSLRPVGRISRNQGGFVKSLFSATPGHRPGPRQTTDAAYSERSERNNWRHVGDQEHTRPFASPRHGPRTIARDSIQPLTGTKEVSSQARNPLSIVAAVIWPLFCVPPVSHSRGEGRLKRTRGVPASLAIVSLRS